MNGEPGKVDASLLAAAGGAPAAAPAAIPGAPAAPASTDWKRDAKEIWQLVASLHAIFPSLKPVYTPGAIDALADAWAPILERHQFKAPAFMMYFVAGAVTLPVAVATAQGITADLKAAKSGRRPAAPSDVPAAEAPAAPAAAVVDDAAPKARDPDLDGVNKPIASDQPAELSAPIT
jgi:hypothetical protein